MRVSATRMELLRLRRRLQLARKGHRLLKEKQDELVRRFFALFEEYLRLRADLRGKMETLAAREREVRIEADEASLEVASWPPPPALEIETRYERILNLQVPKYGLRQGEQPPAYGPDQLPPVFDELLDRWRRSAPLLVKTAEREKALLLLSTEIEATRRRVNALEHNLIPELEVSIRTINFRLAENELGNLTRLMRVKENVRRQ